MLVFSGGGLFFYWQAGVVTFLRENGYDLSNVDLAGASAGALTATLTATNVDFCGSQDPSKTPANALRRKFECDEKDIFRKSVV